MRKNEIDNDLIDKRTVSEKEIDPDCTFCKYKTGKISREQLRIMWDMHTDKELSIHCPKCNETIKF